MYISRDIDLALSEWATSKKRKPLLLRGVRQCGKTTAVRNLGESFDDYIELNLEKRTSLHAVFEGDIDCKRILNRLELEIGHAIVPGQTLIFIDEIQECPQAITALRYFYEDYPELHIIAAGSLLEFVLFGNSKEKTYDFPVGRMRSIYMYPLSFKEFLTGIGEELLCEYLENLDFYDVKNDAHTKLLERYKEFLIIGGMPEAVSIYIETGSLVSCQDVHRDILVNLTDDLIKYNNIVPSDILSKVFNFALRNVCNQVRSSSAISNVSAYYFDLSINLLHKVGLLYPVKASSCEHIPIAADEKETNKKLLFFDTGLYLTGNQLNTADVYASEIFSEMNKGDVVEMQTGLELIKASNPREPKNLHYWYRSKADAEVDYVIQQDSHIIPIEVKASNKGSMQSMRSYLKQFPSVPYGIRVSLENFQKYDNVRVYPVYAVHRI